MNIFPIIEKLVTYGEEHLSMDELDAVYCRNKILERLALDEYEQYEIDIDEIDAMDSPETFLEQLFQYALNKGIVKEDDKQAFCEDIMDIISLRPGQMTDEFGNILKRNSTKAMAWLSDYCLKNGSVTKTPYLRKWEAKGTKGKLEINIIKPVEKKSGKYPECELCLQNVGHGSTKSIRPVLLPIGNENNYWLFDKAQYAPGLGKLLCEFHSPAGFDLSSVEYCFDFVEMFPDYFAVLPYKCSHAHLWGGFKTLPFHRAPELKKVKSKEYPYINMSIVDWYMSAIRLTCTNREKLIEFTMKLAKAYLDKEKSREVIISVRMIEAKYCVEIIFDDASSKVSPYASVIKEKPSDLDKFGIITLKPELDNYITQFDIYLTKEIPFSADVLPQDIKPYKQMLVKLMKEVGDNKISSLEAQIDIKDEINTTCEKMLSDLKVFDEKTFAEFLSTIGIE